MPPLPRPSSMPATEEDLDSLVTWTAIRVGRLWEHALGATLAAHGLTPVQFGVLAQLSVHPALTQAELARRVMMRPQSMHHLLDALEQRNLLQRNADRGSGRPNPVDLTAAGVALLSRVWPIVQKVNEPESLGVDEHRVRALRNELRHLLAVAQTRLDAAD